MGFRVRYLYPCAAAVMPAVGYVYITWECVPGFILRREGGKEEWKARHEENWRM